MFDLSAMDALKLVAALTLSFVGFIYLTRRPALPLPPSPPQHWISGNYRDMPKRQNYRTYAQWAKIYGPVFHLRLFDRYIIILNNAKSALNLLESRSNTYSDRPRSVFLDKVVKRNQGVFRIPFNHPRFRIYRKMMHSGLSPRAVQGYQPLQTREVNILLRSLADAPKDFIPHLRRNAGSLILKVTYGYEVTSDNDDFIQLVERAFQVSASRLTRPMPVEFFPFLRFFPSWFPFTEFKQVAVELDEARTELIPFQWSKNLIDSGNYTDSFVSRFLRPEDGSIPEEEDQDILKWVAVALYVGGADTTVSAMTSFFYVMEMYPEVQKRAQADIDKLTAGSRLPTPDDEEALPYVVALIKEVIRWYPVAPLGLQHRVMEDDVYEGYHIPKGATVMANIWAINHDPEVFPNPDEFNPDRHLGDNPQIDPFKFVFGFGRRVCPGQHLAERSLFLTIANILAVFNLEKEVDEKGNVVEPPLEFHGNVTSHLKPFPCKITVRAPGLLPVA
ncbi:cytochrome p450 [Moniliophthora roreri]|nr:cytochrome p450 [Moniliophthora roreri]